MGSALAGLAICIWIAAAAGCAGPAEEQAVSSDQAQRCWAAVTLEGGSGKASVDSPCPVMERSGEWFVRITWSSSHYDYMVVNGEKILPVNTEGNSQFEIPLGMERDSSDTGSVESPSDSSSEALPPDCEMQVQADTTAMGTPHLIDYTLSFRFYETQEEAESAGMTPQESESSDQTEQNSEEQAQADASTGVREAPVLTGLQYLSEDANEYAQGFAIYRYEKGYSVLSVDDGRQYLIVPEGEQIPEDPEPDLIVLQKPLDRIYLAASAAMCQFDEIGAVSNVILSGLEKDGWYIEAARRAMEEGTLKYGGKYSTPDYELITASGVNLAVESTMIHHTPKVQEKLEKLGVPVLIDRSSYESEPLGRAEWVKVYGLLTGREEEAANAFEEQKGYVEALQGDTESDSGRTAAIFSINSARQVVTRSGGDYYGRMMEIAGGSLQTPAAEAGRATQTVSMESFYAAAGQADILIYNASIEDAPQSLAQMCAKDTILTEFKAVKEGNVWCMRSSLYQNASRTGAVIRDLHAILAGEAGDETEFFYRLR